MFESSLHVNPYTLPADQHGWRGLTVPGNHKRKWYTVLHNDKLLVTALLLIPGEASIRHSHESGELSVHFSDELRPEVTWNPPGFVHGGPPAPRPSLSDAVAENLKKQQNSLGTSNADIASLVEQIMQLQTQMQELERQLREQTRPAPSPRVIVDILFPPFRTTIDDPATESKTVTGQWFD
ncbi:MAG: hypothetical protein HW416_3937 [Chloroflexi bacterium]|nr:hypothetical protein [Chloroflexota bacterium]